MPDTADPARPAGYAFALCLPGCRRDAICEPCLDAARGSFPLQAESLGAMWAERICRGEQRGKQWSDVDLAKATAIARRQLASHWPDPRLVDELLPRFLEAAEQWWNWRPGRYRLA